LTNKSDNRSLFLYTALIFIVAILLIVISFFSKANLQKQHDEFIGEHTDTNSIAEKTAKISEENMILLDKVSDLNSEITDLNSQVTELTDKNTQLSEKLSNTELMLKIYNLIQQKRHIDAEQAYSQLDVTLIDNESLEFYEYLGEALRKNYNKRY